jgi:hypothetical protein
MEEIKPLLAHIQELKSGKGGALSSTQLMAFFLQRRVQPLQHRLSKFWTFSGLEDPSRVSKNLMEKKDLDRHVRALTTLTKDNEVADLAASHFNSEHPLPAVIFDVFTLPCFSLLFFALYLFRLFCLCRIIDFLFLALLSQKEGTFSMFLFLRPPKPPETKDSHDGDEGEDSLERSSSTMSPPPALSKDIVVDRKRRHVEEIDSSRASAPKTVAGESFEPEDGGELFDYMDS